MPQSHVITSTAELAASLGAKRKGKGWRAKCPLHDGGSDNSLSIDTGQDGQPRLHCFGGCTTESLKKHLGIWHESCSQPEVVPSLDSTCPDKRIVTKYTYEFLSGDPAFTVHRTEEPSKPKRFAQQLPDGSWQGLPSGRPLYHAIRIREESDSDVLIVEGEKTVAAAQAIFPDLVVSTSAGGSQAAKLTDWTLLRGRNVTIWPDNDSGGKRYAQDVATLCNDAKAATVRTVQLPNGIPDKWDLADDPGSLDLRNLYQSAKSQGRLLTITAQDLIREPDPEHQWLVKGMLTLPGTSMLCGSPKAGKSTISRRLAVAVATGERFLGSRTTQGRVLLAAIGENRATVKRDLQRLSGRLGTGRLDVLTRENKPDEADRFTMLREYTARTRPALVVVDTVGRWMESFDELRYSEVGNALQPFSDLSDEFGCHICLTHHSRKGGSGKLEDALGSQSFSGGVDTVMLTWNNGYGSGHRFRAQGRDEVEIPSTPLAMGADGWIEFAADPREAKAEAERDAVMAAIAEGYTTLNRMLPIVGMQKRRLSALLSSMAADGILTSKKDGQRIVYRIIEGPETP